MMFGSNPDNPKNHVNQGSDNDIHIPTSEANYLIGFRSADEIRNLIAKARKETNR